MQPDRDGVLLALVTIVMLCAATVVRPKRATCPRTWALDTGVRTDGSYSCWSPPAPECNNTMPGRDSDECHARYPAAVHIDSRIYCTNNQQPIVVDGATVGCQPGGATWP